MMATTPTTARKQGGEPVVGRSMLRMIGTVTSTGHPRPQLGEQDYGHRA